MEEVQTPAWPGAEVWPLDRIKPYPSNTRTHPDEQVQLLADMLRRWGPDQPIVVDEEGIILKGHGRRLGALRAKMIDFPVVQRMGLPEQDKRALRIADNQIALLAGWDNKLMTLELGTLKTAGYDMRLLAFPQPQLVEWGVLAPAPDAERGRLLELVNITIEDPKHAVEHGDHFILDERHHLLAVSVIADWPLWNPLLVHGALFCPYPGVFVPFSDKAAKHPLVMVQPDPYIAGHILDRWVEVHGKKKLTKVT